MKDFSQGYGHQDLHGPSHNGAAMAGAAHAKVGGGTSPSVSEGKAEPRSMRAQRQEDDTAANTTDYMYRQENMGGATREGAALAVNSNRYNLAQAGNAVSAERLKDTDEVIAQSRGDAPGTEYAENSSGQIVPDYASMAKAGKQVPSSAKQRPH